MKAYKHLLNGVDGPENWPKTGMISLQPPDRQKQLGRLKKARKKQHDEPPVEKEAIKFQRRGTQNKCSICKEIGHNKRGCENSKENRGRDLGELEPNSFTVFGEECLSNNSNTIAQP